MSVIVQCLDKWNEKKTLSNSDVISFTGFYATGVSTTDYALLIQAGQGRFVSVNAIPTNAGISAATTASQNASNTAANTAFTNNQQNQNTGE